MAHPKQPLAPYSAPQIVGQEDPQHYSIGPGAIIVICVAIALLALLGALGVCLYFGYDGIAYTIHTNNFSATLACYNN